MRRLASVAVLLSFVLACQPADIEEVVNPFVGAWQITEMSFAGPDTNYTITNPQPGLYLFGERHYSIMYVPTGEPRPLAAGDAPIIGAINPTDAEKVASWNTFIANSGTYEVRDTTVTFRPVVAKSANLMAAGGPLVERYVLTDDTLQLWFAPPWAPDEETHTTLVRIQ